jgi:hypothetical protein
VRPGSTSGEVTPSVLPPATVIVASFIMLTGAAIV